MFRRAVVYNIIALPVWLAVLAAFICGVVWGIVKVLQATGVL